MKRLESFLRTRREQHSLLVAYVTAGYPDEQTFLRLLPALEAAGADAIEIGLPFSDPLADGPVIQRASARAIQQGMTGGRALALAAQLSGEMSIPLIAMGYVNPLLSYGLQRFLVDASEAGIQGLILPDLPLDADPRNERLISSSSLARVQLATPASTAQRLDRLAGASEGFVYVVSRLGVTGGLLTGNPQLPGIILELRRATDLPLLTGFGISDAAGAAAAAAQCDGVIVGSALLQRLEDNNTAVADATEFLAGIRRGLDSTAGADSAVRQEKLT